MSYDPSGWPNEILQKNLGGFGDGPMVAHHLLKTFLKGSGIAAWNRVAGAGNWCTRSECTRAGGCDPSLSPICGSRFCFPWGRRETRFRLLWVCCANEQFFALFLFARPFSSFVHLFSITVVRHPARFSGLEPCTLGPPVPLLDNDCSNTICI
jgi:hypothetical protein